MSTYEEIVEREQKFLLNTYARYPMAMARGKGVYVYDVNGKRYLDFLTGLGVNALGHAHPRIVKVIRDQAAKVIHVSNLYYNEYQGLLAEKLCTASGLDRAFFSNSGTEAIEGALKLVRAAGHATGGPEKSIVIALDNSFHGRTMGALALTGQPKYRKDFDPMLEGVRFVPRNDVEALRAAMDEKVCAIVLEPIQGEGGIQETSTGVSEGVPRAGRSASGRAHLRRDPMRHGTHRAALRVPAFRRHARCGLHRQADRRRIAARRVSGEREIRATHHARQARHDLRRRPADLPRGAGVSGDSGRRKSAGAGAPRGRLLPAEAAGAGRQVRHRDGSSRRRRDPGAAVDDSRASRFWKARSPMAC